MNSEFDFDAPSPTPETRDVYTPGRLNREARMLLERGLPTLWLEGEISNLSRPSSGHWYFSLKDENAQLRCAMFRQRNLLTRFVPKDGAHVLLRGRVSLYEQRGDYQFIAEHMEEAGEGALRRRFEMLKTRLAAEGMFAAERKRPLPRMPRRIGVVTSPTGAAIRDILNILRRRFCTIPVLIYPVQVQGAAAAGQIARTIRLASARAECDVLILARGGGSLEDLWAFNEEVVARAIYDCKVPIVSGVGHETDFTIADFVADVRAPTPSGAAELVAPDCNEWSRSLALLVRRLQRASQRILQSREQHTQNLSRRLQRQHPGVLVRQKSQRLDELERRALRAFNRLLQQAQAQAMNLRQRLLARHPRGQVRDRTLRVHDYERRSLRAVTRVLQQYRQRTHVLSQRLSRQHPGVRLDRDGCRLVELDQRAARAMRHVLHRQHQQLAATQAQLQRLSPIRRVADERGRVRQRDVELSNAIRRRLATWTARIKLAEAKLNTVSPLATLQRGYAIVTDHNGAVLTHAGAVIPGSLIRARLADGQIVARVEDDTQEAS